MDAFEQLIKVYQKDTNGKPTTVGLRIADGREWAFLAPSSGTIYTHDADINDTLESILDVQGQVAQWVRTNGNDSSIETYDSNGTLLNISSKSGLIQTLTYSNLQGQKYPVNAPECRTPLAINSDETSSRLNCVTDSFGNQVNYAYGAKGFVSKATNPAGGVYTYTYSTDGTNNLTSVTYPDGKTKTYRYGEPSNVSPTPQIGVVYASSLTGIIDENGNRYATYRYDAAGRAYDEELAPSLGASTGQPIERNTLVYNVDSVGNPTTTQVTDSRGSVRTYNFTTILGVVKNTGQSQPAGSGCAASGSAISYDVNGNTSSKTDFNGNKTTYVYDMARNLETSRTEGLNTAGNATPATRTITTTWHPTWRLPLVTSEYDGATATGTDLRRTTNVYDTKGNITSITVADLVRNLTRITTITYTYSSVVPGLVLSKVVNGPRTDVNDITTYNYYDANATCTASSAAPLIDPITNTSPDNLGCRGQLLSMTNATGSNHHLWPLQPPWPSGANDECQRFSHHQHP
ncbi:hypothetical protein [Candidatus Nitrotoga sp. 1052]|uniref:hypothetical protein n=1 Tax=Candidatus Nitrotoga sp. 1052 TaxID=2886964 RepID=UPI001EF5ABE3|nr:hypothetical protein [Candidatus Nitrotoga sp. 1052]